MIDLAAKVHYKARFEIHKQEDQASLFNSFFLDIKNWVCAKHRGSKLYWNWDQVAKYGKFECSSGNVFLNTTSYFISNDHRYWAMKFDETQIYETSEKDLIETSPRVWTTEIGYEQESKDTATVSLICYYVDRACFVGLQADPPMHSTPQILYRFLTNSNFSCMSGSTLLSIKVKLAGNGYGEKLGREICSKSRGLPYILIIPAENIDNAPNSISSNFYTVEWAKNLALSIVPNVIANARVYYAEDTTFSEELSFFVPKEQPCHPGSLYIYWPVYTDEKDQDVIRRRFFTPDQINGLGQELLVKIIRRVLSNDINYYESHEMFRRQDCDALYRKQKMLELREQYSHSKQSAYEATESSSILERLLNLADSENSEYRETIEKLEEECKKITTDNFELRSFNTSLITQNDTLREKARSLENIRNITDLPRTVSEVIDFFEKVFPDKIVFTERAKRTINTCITKPEIVWDCLYNISVTLVDLYRMSSCPNIPSVFKERTRWDMARGEGAETKKSNTLMQQRRDFFQGKEINIEPHVKKGNKDNADSIRVYFTYNGDIKKIIIGHIGIHIDNFSSTRL